MKLLLKGYEHNPNLTLKEFLYNFLTDLNYKHDTIFETGNTQCLSHKNRSLGDITLIVNGYYPETSRETVKEILLNFGSRLAGHYCPDIGKRVYLHKDRCNDWLQHDHVIDEYGDPIEYLTDEQVEEKERQVRSEVESV